MEPGISPFKKIKYGKVGISSRHLLEYFFPKIKNAVDNSSRP
jgi:hypothetical protein